MNVLSKLLKGDVERKTRLHDEKGNLIRPSRFLRNAPRAYLTGFGRILFNRRPELPWISYDAIKIFAAHLTPQSRVLEFGSGMSTIWYAKHAAHVRSVENYAPWYEKVSAHLRRKNFKNVDYIFSPSPEDYVHAAVNGQEYDFIMVDGSHRSDCLANAITHLAPGGILYLDNSDKDFRSKGDVTEAERLALDYARRNGWTHEFFTDFGPTLFTVTEGLLVRNTQKTANPSSRP